MAPTVCGSKLADVSTSEELAELDLATDEPVRRVEPEAEAEEP